MSFLEHYLAQAFYQIPILITENKRNSSFLGPNLKIPPVHIHQIPAPSTFFWKKQMRSFEKHGWNVSASGHFPEMTLKLSIVCCMQALKKIYISPKLKF